MKLLDRTIKSYILYSVLLIVSSTPLFYFSIRYIVVREMDNVLTSHKEDFVESLIHLKSSKEMEFFPLMNKEFILIPATVWPIKDSIFSQNIPEADSRGSTPHRVYKTGVSIGGSNYELNIRESLVSNRALIGSITVIQLIMLVFLLTGLVIINRSLSRKIWNPFYVTLDRLKNFNLDQDKTITLPQSSTAEFRELTNAVEQLICRNKEVYQNQKEFTENAAHELQTPIAICRTKLELLAQTKELTHEQAELVERLLEAVNRMARLNKNLLLLARIESRQFMDIIDLDIRTLTERIVRAFNHQVIEHGLRIDTGFDQALDVKGNTSILEILLNNLISNAVRHSPRGGAISIVTTTNSIIIRNTGEPLQHPEKMFDRFYRNSQTDGIGNGLGLSILKKICDIYNYRIKYAYEKPNHRFEVVFHD